MYDARGFPPDDFISIAAYLLECITRNHCLVDGNKRFAFGVAMTYLEYQELTLGVTNDEAAVFIRTLSSGERREDAFEKAKRWIDANIIALN